MGKVEFKLSIMAKLSMLSLLMSELAMVSFMLLIMLLLEHLSLHLNQHLSLHLLKSLLPKLLKLDVVDVAVGAGAFTTLVKVVGDLGLVETLKGVEAVTIFAPSDEAFAKLPEGTLESLTPEQAKAIVARHVVAG